MQLLAMRLELTQYPDIGTLVTPVTRHGSSDRYSFVSCEGWACISEILAINL